MIMRIVAHATWLAFATLAPALVHAVTLTLGPGESILAVLPRLQPGDTLFLRGGTYGEKLVLTAGIMASGTAANPITIASAPGEQAMLTGGVAVMTYDGGTLEYLIFDRLLLEGAGFFFGGPNTNHVRLQNSEVRSVGQSGIFGYGGGRGNQVVNVSSHHNGHSWLDHGLYVLLPDFLIEGGSFYSNSGYGVQIYDTTPGMVGDGTIIRGVQIYNNCTAPGGCGNVTLSHGAGMQFLHNRVSGHANAVDVSYGVRLVGTRVACNTIDGTIAIGVAAQQTLVERNQLHGQITDAGQGSILRDNGPEMPGAGDPLCGAVTPPPPIVAQPGGPPSPGPVPGPGVPPVAVFPAPRAFQVQVQ
jgi:hypothetical protein